ncbi:MULTISPECIES: DUF3243 domain-containing protein [Psychrobacillus]|uniref:DUF3243 domain-containing protein n=1 Tax=Psychrobacillus faecigallinarum TaxID=2762235 RepID=A0ABR8RB87_9BACI|nr:MULTISPECIES: DUF3243 domain-containing protein [Psychrobacillus]MBD7944782.1 DUF3243 domain-containing protein [Psychrobacillus faecigallinarum]QEY21237.1 DUF3243 domain-containing protein [Psychrobacillus sp. AK 1817]QGM31754.1 DUF3243 family protein [Bacillus sp. N3536]
MDRKIDKQVEVALESFSTDEKNDILKNFTTFKDYLSDKVRIGEKMGLSDDTLAKATEKVAGYLAANEEPKNREEHLLQQLWKSADKDQQHALSHMLLKLTRNEG